MDAKNCNIVVWNVRGLNNPSRRTAVRVVVGLAAALVVCASESKLETISHYVVSESFGPQFDEFAFLSAIGTAGGIVVAWCSEDVHVLSSRVDGFSVSIQLETSTGEPWWLTSVYGPTVEALKPAFLAELRTFRAAVGGPWAITGDFNLILDARDKNNANLNRRSMANFRALVNDLELKEACLLGRRYTWSNERDQPTLVRIDRWFASVGWDELYPNATLTALSSSLSVHRPLLMSTAVMLASKRRFCFERFWTRLEGFGDAVASSWANPSSAPDPLRCLDLKLRRLAKDLKRWSAQKVGNIRDQILVANEVIFRLEAAQDRRAISQAETELRRALKKRLLGLASLERMIARQRARVHSLREGDAATQFFRIKAAKRKRWNHIYRLQVDDAVETEQGGLRILPRLSTPSCWAGRNRAPMSWP
jgi:hypothetical protein